MPKAIVVVLENLHSEHVNRRAVQNAVQAQTGGGRAFDATDVYDEVCGQVCDPPPRALGKLWEGSRRKYPCVGGVSGSAC